MNTKKTMEAKNEFEKNSFKLMTNSVFGKAMENMRKHRDIKLVTTEEKRSKVISEPNYYSTKRLPENFFENRNEKNKQTNKMNKPVISKLDISKVLMYKFWYGYIWPKYENKAKLCYTDTDRFIIHIITEDFFEEIAGDVKKWFDTYNYDENDKRPLPIRINKRVYGFFKDELGVINYETICYT